MGNPNPGDTHLHRYDIHKRVATRFRRERGVITVAAEPIPVRPVQLTATLDSATFFDQQLGIDDATLEFEWRSRFERDEFSIQYTEPGTPWACGWHQEGLGQSHFQIDHEAWAAPHREVVSFTDPNPMVIIETSLSELRKRVPTFPDSAESDTRLQDDSHNVTICASSFETT